MAKEGVVSVFSKVNDDILQNIMGRLPAVGFACAACVNKTWYRNCRSILCRPKFVSAMSLNPDSFEAVDEVFDEVFSRPIRPDFAIVYIGMEFSLPVTSQLVSQKLPSEVPVIINQAVWLIGVDAGAQELIEVKWELENVSSFVDYWNGNILMGGATLPLFQVLSTQLVSQSSEIIIRPVIEKLDEVMPEETAIVGDAKGSFLFRRRKQTQNYSAADLFFFDAAAAAAAALVFARDQNESDGTVSFNIML